MIKVYKGEWRGLGKKGTHVSINLDVEFRDKIYHFSGAKLHVFMAIALHADQEGEAFPSYDKLEKETGYGRDTIARALNELCELKIDGERVLARYRIRDEKGRYVDSNRYLIFPTKEEIEAIHSTENTNSGKTKDGKGALEGSTSKDKGFTNDKGNNTHSKNSNGNKPRDPFFDAIVEVCRLAPDKLNGGAVMKVQKRLIAAGWTSADVLAYGKTRNGKPPLLHTLDTDMAVKGWRVEDKPSNVNPEMKIYR